MIYLIMSGEYSSKEIHGYFTTPEDAYTYCELYNEKKLKEAQEDVWFEERRVVPVQEVQAELPERPPMVYTYRREFRPSRGYVTNDGSTSWTIYDFEDGTPYAYAPAVDESIKPGVRWVKAKALMYDYYLVTINLTTPDPEKATKIAQDTFYQVIAQKEGLSI